MIYWLNHLTKLLMMNLFWLSQFFLGTAPVLIGFDDFDWVFYVKVIETVDSILASTWLIAETMEYVWTRRKKKENFLISSLSSHLLLHAEHLERTKKHNQAANVIKEIISWTLFFRSINSSIYPEIGTWFSISWIS